MEWNTGDAKFLLILLKRRHKNYLMNKVIDVRKIKRFIRNPMPKENAEKISYF